MRVNEGTGRCGEKGLRWLGFWVFWMLLPMTISCQQTRLIAYLDKRVKESSGLTYISGELLTHNDSGDKAYIYVIDTFNGQVKYRVKLKKSDNVDWEDICHDESYIYIGDIGNNRGDRRDLTIYKVAIDAFFSHPDGKISAEQIHYKYAEQKDFSPRNHRHNFDAETLISYRDSLYIFTKNWKNFKTYIYKLPKEPGSYTLRRIDSLDAGILVTGGLFSNYEQSFMLTGYRENIPYLIRIDGVRGDAFSKARMHKSALIVSSSTQVEAIAEQGRGRFFISGEEDNTGHPASLYMLIKRTTASEEVPATQFRLQPNPGRNILRVESQSKALRLTIYALDGRVLGQAESSEIHIEHLVPGVYYLHVLDTVTMHDGILPFSKN